MLTVTYTPLPALLGRHGCRQRAASTAARAAPLSTGSLRYGAARPAASGWLPLLHHPRHSTVQSGVAAAATGQPVYDAANGAARPALRRRWLATFTLPGPGFADGPDYHDFFLSNTTIHLANSFIFGALYFLGGMAYWGDARGALTAYLVAAGATLFTEGLVHWRSNKFHAVHAVSVWIFNAYIGAFLAAGGLGQVLAGPRDFLYVLFWLGPVLFGMIAAPATSVITFLRSAEHQ